MARRTLRRSSPIAQPVAPKVYGYVRVSSQMQVDSNLSLVEQQRRIEGRVLEQGWTLKHIFVEPAVSGSMPLAQRPEGGKLIALLQPGDIVIGAKLDRLFRNTVDALQTIEAFRKRRISLWLLDLGGDCTGNGISALVLSILSAVAQFERERIGERLADAKRQMRERGLLQGGSPPFGYTLGEPAGRGRTRHLIPDPAQQEAIATMHRMREEGATLMQIRDHLRGQGFRISHQTIGNILARSAEGAA